MPSTYTGSGIELIGDGEQSGSWGNTTNNNLEIINRLVSEAGTITLAGTTHTLTIADGTLSDGQYAVLVFGGAPSGTNTVTLSPNDAKRVFIVKNDSGESVVLTQGSGGNVTVGDGKTAIVYSDGAGSGAAVVNVSDDFIVATLTDIGALTPTDGNFIVGNGSTWVAETGNTVLSSIGVTATTTELNFVDGVTSNIQTQLGTKAETATTITAGAGLTGGGDLSTNRTISHADTSSQASVDNSGATVIQDVTLDTYGHVTGLASATLGLGSFGVTASATELNYTTGVTSGIQTQLDALDTGKAPLASPTFTNDVTISDTAPELVFVDTNGSSGLSQTALVQDANKLQFETRDSSGVFVGRDYVIEKASSGAQTHIFYLNDTERVRFAATGAIGLNGENYGTSGQVLTSAGIAAPPSWQTLASDPTTEQVTTAYAGASAWAVGTYTTAWYALAGLLDDGSGSSIAVGTTIAGSSLRVPTSSTLSNNSSVGLYPDSFSALAGSGSNFNTANTVTLSGTWRVMTSGKYKIRVDSDYAFYPHLWLRIS